MGNGIPARVMGDGEGFSTLILTDKESLLMRKVLEQLVTPMDELRRAREAFNLGIQRGTAKIAEEFKEEARRRKDGAK